MQQQRLYWKGSVLPIRAWKNKCKTMRMLSLAHFFLLMKDSNVKCVWFELIALIPSHEEFLKTGAISVK